MTREELEALLTLPEHKIVEVEFEIPKTSVIIKCGFPLTMNQELDELGQVVGEYYAGNDYAIVKGKDVSVANAKGYLTGRITRIIDNYDGPRITGWAVNKIDPALHEQYEVQEARITRLHEKLDMIWNWKDGTSKLDILLDELLALEQAEAEAINETL